MQLSKAELHSAWKLDKRTDRRRFVIAIAALTAVFLFCLCFRYNGYYYKDKFVPLEYLKSFWLALKLLFSRIFGTVLYARREMVIEEFGSVIYYGALARLRITLMSLVAGAGLAIAGAIFQTAYRNPMASPNIIGATAGVGLGNVLVVMLYSAAALENITLRYKYCYGLTAICVCAVLLLGKIAGNKHESYSIMEMIMAGAIVSQTLRVFTMYIMYNLEDEDLLLYEQISMGTYLETDALTMTIFFSVMGVSILPVLLMRFRLNGIGMDRMESSSIGISTKGMRLIGQICGVIMVTCSMVHCGEIGMISLVIPYAVRRFIGSDFRHVVVYSAICGGALLMLCRLAASFIYIADEPIPVTFVIELILTPAFMVILAKHRRGYNEA